MDMIDMKMTAAEQTDYCGPVSPMSGAPKYPYGLEVRLDDAGIQKLGLKALPMPGQEMILTARVSVTMARQEADQEGVDRSLSIQITKMALDAAQPEKSTAEVLYNKVG